MLKNIYLLVIILSINTSFGQNLTVNEQGNVLDENKLVLKTNEVQKLLANYPEQLLLFNAGNKKKSIGNILLLSGCGLIATDLVISLTSDQQFPKLLSAIGLGAIIVAIPIKMGYSKKINTAINDYNNNKKIGYNNKLEVISNNAGIGLKLTFK